MNRLVLLVATMVLAGSVSAQHPSFKLNAHWGKGQLNGLAVADSLIWYLEGSVVVSAVIHSDGKASRLGELELNMAPAGLAFLNQHLVIYGSELVILKVIGPGELVEVSREPIALTDAAVAGNSLFLRQSGGVKYAVSIAENGLLSTGPLTTPLPHVNLHKGVRFGNQAGLFLVDPDLTIHWYSITNPQEPTRMDTLHTQSMGNFSYALNDSLLFYQSGSGLIVVKPDQELGLTRLDTIDLQATFPELNDIDQVVFSGQLLFAVSQGIVGNVYQVAAVGPDLSVSAYPAWFNDGFRMMATPTGYVEASTFLRLFQVDPTDGPVLKSAILPETGFLGKPIFNPAHPAVLTFYERGDVKVLTAGSSEPELLYSVEPPVSDILYWGNSAISLGDGILYINAVGMFAFLDFSTQPITGKPVSYLSDAAPFDELTVNGKTMLAKTGDHGNPAIYVLDVSTPTTLSIQTIYSGVGKSTIADVDWLGDRAVIAESDSGITVMDSSMQIVQRIRQIGRVKQIQPIRGGLAALRHDGTLMVFVPDESGLLKQAEPTIAIGSSAVLMESVEDFLVVSANRTLKIIDVKTASQPWLAGEIHLPWTSFGLEFTGSQLVISHGKYGYTVFDYSGYQVHVDEAPAETPGGLTIQAVYPNPFNPTTTIALRVPVAGAVTVQVYDLSGRLITTLDRQHREAGLHSIPFHAAGLSSGLYLVRTRLATGEQTTARLMLLK